MKAKFFFLGLCALALAACSIDEVSQVNDTNAVTFKATTITRADVTTTNNLESFSVWAWNTVDGYTTEFMDDVIATRSGSSSTFTTSPLYFWPTGTVDFYALAPATGVTAIENDVEYAFLGGEINEGDDVNPNWTYEGYVAKAQIANGNIVIDACIPSTPEEQIDLCYGVALNQSSGSVPMNFRHALSQIAFKAKSANTAFDVKIADVSVCSVYKEGVYTISAKETSTHLDAGTSTSPAEASQGAWELTTTDNEGYAIKGRYLVDMTSSVVDVPTDGDVVELVDPYGTLMLLPQTIVAWDPLTDYNDSELGSYIRILCHVEENGSQLWPNNNAEEEEEALGDAFWKDAEGVEYAEIAIPLTDVEWEQGYRYTYTLIFGEGLGYYPPDDPNTALEGTPVLDIITFDVTVDEFQDAENTDGKYDVSTDVDLSYIEVKSADELVGAARMGYEVIDVTNDITLENVYVEFTQDCVLNIADNATITATNATNGRDYPAINNYNNYTAAIYVSGGTLTINGGTVATTGGEEALYTEAIWVDGGTVIINSGTFMGGSWNTTDEGSESAVFVEYGAAYIYGGTYSSGKWNANGYYVLNCMDTPYKNKEANIYVYGGTYYLFDPSNCRSEGTGTNFVVDGYSAVADGDYYNVVKTTVTTAADLKAAIAAGASEVTIADDITINDEYLTITSDCTVVLDEGATLYSSADWAGYTMPAFYVTSGTLTIEGEGTVAFDPTVDPEYAPNGVNSGYYGVWVAGGTAVINGGNFISADHAVYCQTGYAYIYGGNFSCTQPASNGEYMVLNCKDANYTNGTANIYVYGGSYGNSFDPSNNLSEGANTNYVVSGYVSTKSSDVDADGFYWYTVTAE